MSESQSGSVAAALSAHGDGRDVGSASARVRSSPIAAADCERAVAGAGLGLGHGDLGQPGVALAGIGRLLGQGHGGGKFARRNLGLDQGVFGVCRGRCAGGDKKTDGCQQQPAAAHEVA